MGKVIRDDDELLELPETLDEDEEALGVDDADDLVLSEIDDGPEEVGLDVETLEGDVGLAGEDDDEDDDAVGGLDDAPLELEGELDDDEEEEGWTDESESEGAGEGFDDDLLDDDEEPLDDDGGLEGVDDPALDGLPDEEERSIIIGGDEPDEGEDDELVERLELDLG